jgi:hypothetical protein
MVEEGVVTFLYLVFTSSHTVNRLQGKFYSLFTITFTITTITTTSISLCIILHVINLSLYHHR